MRGTMRHPTETPATAWLRRQGAEFTLHAYEYVEHGGATWAAQALGVDPHSVIKTLIMQDQAAHPLVVLMHGDREVSTRQLARAIGAKQVQPCAPAVAERHSGYRVGGTSPFALRKPLPVYLAASVPELPRLYVNAGRRGLLLGMAPELLQRLLRPTLVDCALADAPHAP